MPTRSGSTVEIIHNNNRKHHRWIQVESVVRDALIRLNALVAQQPSRAEEILTRLRAVTLTAAQEGLVQANREMSQWLRGLASHQFVGTTHSVPVRLIDFDDPTNNDLVVSDEVTCGVPGKKSRFDIVYRRRPPGLFRIAYLCGTGGHHPPVAPRSFAPSPVTVRETGHAPAARR